MYAGNLRSLQQHFLATQFHLPPTMDMAWYRPVMPCVAASGCLACRQANSMLFDMLAAQRKAEGWFNEPTAPSLLRGRYVWWTGFEPACAIRA